MVGVLILMKFRIRKEFRDMWIQIPPFTDILYQIQETELWGCFLPDRISRKEKHTDDNIINLHHLLLTIPQSIYCCIHSFNYFILFIEKQGSNTVGDMKVYWDAIPKKLTHGSQL